MVVARLEKVEEMVVARLDEVEELEEMVVQLGEKLRIEEMARLGERMNKSYKRKMPDNGHVIFKFNVSL